MRVRSVVLCGVTAGLGAVLASGFPLRAGLTRSQAAVSLPGDLIVPMATVVADRGIEVRADVHTVWSVLDAAFELDDESALIDRVEDSHILLRVATPGSGDEDERAGTCVIALEPITSDRTLIHLRERHVTHTRAQRAQLIASFALEAPSALAMLRDLRNAAQR
ncbi:hypothetical protein G7Y41_04180 [Schaalia sp. ZJ405]|uniref:hypothetical protein n=1 Tax=unclassified Schaalia TaxID=2691889 RepID=UPI0013EA0DEE|nr:MULTISPECIES: hypothetical protein [unclassified Schaalia]QPK82009.1 hypothetical protein G7Y41_04180 [Schaalia sp. ZJ405]